MLHNVTLVSQAFDRHASVYDQVFSDLQIRSRVWEIADRFFGPGTHVLDLGCGTGEDAIHFAHRGLRITAIDISPAMIERVMLKGGGIIRCEAADMRTYAPGGARYDGVFSNFGSLNCVSDLDWLSEISLAPSAHLVLTTMGRFYPLESAVFLLKGKPRLALRRFSRPCEAAVEGVRFNVYYHGLRGIRKALGPRFELIEVTGLRSVLPSFSFEHLERFRALRLLGPLDHWLCSHRLTASCSDHFVSVWRPRET